MNGSLIKTPSVCMSHTDAEAANNESSELDQSDDELTKELFQPKPRISIGQKRKKKNATEPISQPQPISSSTQMMIKSQGESSNHQPLSDMNESLEDMNDISVMAGGPNLVSVSNLVNASNLVDAPNLVNAPTLTNAPNVEKDESRMDETIADTGNETLTQEMDVTLDKSNIMDSTKKKSKKNKREKTKKKKFRKSLGF